MNYRAFISVDVGALRPLERLNQELRECKADIKLVDPRSMHLTVEFLGSVNVCDTETIVDAMRRSVEGIDPFDIGLEGMGAFPSPLRLRVIWIGVQCADPLAVVARRLHQYLDRQGIRCDERPFSAHLTVARMRGPRGSNQIRDLIADNKGSEFGPLRVEAIRLKRSTLSPQGPRYDTVAEVRL